MIGALLLLLVILVALAPTIASSGPVRSMVVGKINQQLNGTIEIADWSLGWSGPIEASGIKVYDEQKRLILDVPRAKITLSLIDAARQNFALGEGSVIDVASFVVNVDESGKTNLERLPKTTSSGPKPASQGETRLPDVSGKLTLNIQQGTIEGAGVAKPIHVQPSTAVVHITDINQPIQNEVKLAYNVEGGATSTIEARGTVDAIKNNVVSLETLSAGQKVSLANVNLAAVEPFLKTMGADTRLAGLVSGGIDIKAEGLTGISADGNILINSFRFSGGPLGADAFQTEQIAIPVKVTRAVVDPSTTLIKIETVNVTMAQANLAVTGQITEQALLNLANQKPPGSDGSITITADITDLPNLANQLRNSLNLQQGVAITGGAVHETITITLDKEKVTVAQSLDASAKGTRDGKPIELKPITVNAGLSARPTGKMLPDVRDLKLDMTSVFATVKGGGETLAKVGIDGQFDLNKLAAEVGQFADLGQIQLQGTGSFAVNTNGDLTDANAPIDLKATANLLNVKVSGVADRRIDQDQLIVEASGVMTRKDNAPQEIQKGYVSILSGDPKAPMLEVYANGIVNLQTMSLPWFEVAKCNVSSLPRIQQQYGGFVPVLAEQKITIDNGALYATVAGSYDGKTIKLSKPAALSIPTLTVSKDGRRLLDKEVIRAAVLGDVSLDRGITGNFTDLSVTSQSKLFELTKTGDAPLSFTMSESAIRGGGAMTIAADLKRLTDLAQAFGGTVSVSADQPQLRSGQFNGTVTLAKAEKPETSIKLDGRVTALTIATGQTNTVENEQLTIGLSATAPDDLAKNPILADVKVGSAFVNSTIADVRLVTTGGVFDMLQSANVEAQVPDVPKLVALVNAVSPMLGDLQVTSGGAMVRMSIARDAGKQTTNLNVSDARISRLALARGPRSYAFDRDNPISLRFSAAVKTGEQIQAVTVNELSGDVRVASLSMPEKIVIDNPLGEKPSYQGAIQLSGAIHAVTPLLAVLQGADPMPYAGSYQLAQRIVTADAKTTLAGSIDVEDFQVLDAKRQPVFREPRLAIKNDLDVDLKSQKLAIQALTVDMPQSQALAMTFARGGGVNFWADRREIRPNTKVDVSYDLAKLWTIVYPMLSPEQQASYKDLKVAGKHQQTFELSGAFPAKETLAESFKTLNVNGGFAIDLLETMGLRVEKLEPQLRMRQGIAAISAKPATANQGTLNLNGIRLDMTSPDPLLTIPPKTVILSKAALNPVLASSLGRAGAVMFTEATEAEGLLTVVVEECDQVPLGALLASSEKSRAKLVLSVDELNLDGVVPRVLASAADTGTKGIKGRIPPSNIVIANGRAVSDISIEIGVMGKDPRTGREVLRPVPLGFKGGLGLAKFDLQNFIIDIPVELLRGDLRKAFPNGASIPLKGLASRPELDLQKAIIDNAGRGILGGDAGGILDQVLGGNRDRPREEPRRREPSR